MQLREFPHRVFVPILPTRWTTHNAHARGRFPLHRRVRCRTCRRRRRHRRRLSPPIPRCPCPPLTRPAHASTHPTRERCRCPCGRFATMAHSTSHQRAQARHHRRSQLRHRRQCPTWWSNIRTLILRPAPRCPRHSPRRSPARRPVSPPWGSHRPPSLHLHASSQGSTHKQDQARSQPLTSRRPSLCLSRALLPTATPLCRPSLRRRSRLRRSRYASAARRGECLRRQQDHST